MAKQIGNPFPFYNDRRGRPLDGGKIFVGTAGDDPQISPIDVFYDAELTQLASQPINVIGGLAVQDGSPVLLFTASEQFSVRVRDADGAQVFYAANADTAAAAFQPVDDDLSAIAALTTTAFGRSLLTQATASNTRTLLGIPDALPLTGGVVTGNITRSNAGGHPYFADSALANVPVYVTANGAADPRTGGVGIWLEEVAP